MKKKKEKSKKAADLKFTLRQYVKAMVSQLPKLPDPAFGGIQLPFPKFWKGSKKDWADLEELGGSAYSETHFRLPAKECHKLATVED